MKQKGRFCTSPLCILERRGTLVCPVTSCNQNAFLQKHTAEKEELNHRLEYIYSADRHTPTVKQAPQLQ